jgi:hypothetical protein
MIRGLDQSCATLLFTASFLFEGVSYRVWKKETPQWCMWAARTEIASMELPKDNNPQSGHNAFGGTHKDHNGELRNVIERLAAIRRDKVVLGDVEFEKVTTPEPEQQTILDYLKVRL